MSQYLYVLTHPSLPGKVIVGRTLRGRDDGAAEMPASAGSPGHYTVAHAEPVTHGFAAEQLAHILLMEAGYRPDHTKARYTISVSEAIRIVGRAALEIRQAFPPSFAGPGEPAWNSGISGDDSASCQSGRQVGNRRGGPWSRWLKEARPRITQS